MRTVCALKGRHCAALVHVCWEPACSTTVLRCMHSCSAQVQPGAVEQLSDHSDLPESAQGTSRGAKQRLAHARMHSLQKARMRQHTV